MELTQFYTRFIDLTDRVLPAIHHPSDQLVYLQLFSRTLAVGQRTCRISYRDLGELTGLSVVTVKTAIRRLLDQGILRIAVQAAAKVAQTYEVLWPSEEIRKRSRLERSPMVVLKESGAAGGAYEGIIGKLTPEDREMLEILEGSLTLEEEKRLRKMAKESLGVGDNPENKFREMIVMTRFGPERLKKYEDGMS